MAAPDQSCICTQIEGDADLLPAKRLLASVPIKVERDSHALRHRQQVVPVDALVLYTFVILTNPTSIDHHAPLRISFWIEQVIAFLAEMK